LGRMGQSMSRKRNQSDAGDFPELNGEQIERELTELLRKVEPETQRVLASLPRAKKESIGQMRRRHARTGRMLQRIGMEFFRRGAAEGRRPCA
jgi:hypothetical protein